MNQSKMLIVHTPEEAEAQADFAYVDPNSMAYHNAVLEKKFENHSKF